MGNIKEKIINELKKYFNIIINEYKNYMPKEDLEYLQNYDFNKNIHIENTGTISLYVNNKELYLPTLAFPVLEELSKQQNFGSDKTHKAYNKESLIINDNTFLDYINHAVIKGLTPLEYYLENLLHESLHISGICNGSAFIEGVTEYKTRQLASKYGLVTSGCGYPKEVKIVSDLENILGEDCINKIMFFNNRIDMENYINDNYGKEKSELFSKIYIKMQQAFLPYITKKFNGENAIYEKVKAYDKINYEEVYNILEEYNNTKKL